MKRITNGGTPPAQTPNDLDKLRRERRGAIRAVQESSEDWHELTPPVIEVHNHIGKSDSDPVSLSKIGKNGLIGRVVLAAIALGTGFATAWKILHEAVK
jgi:hypothetical protein